MYDQNLFLNLIIAFVVLLVIFFVCRELVCWYWKLNKIVILLEEISAKLGEEQIGLVKMKEQHDKGATGTESRQDDSIPGFMDRR